jgi:hypothetical protein
MARQVIGVGISANDGTGDPVRTAFTKSNSNFSELYGAVFTRVFDVTQYGAVFDGTSDIATGVQAAIDAARTFLNAGNYRSAEIVFPRGLTGVLLSTLNFTGFTSSSSELRVNWNSTGVFAKTNGTPAIDALGSMGIIWDGIHISGQSPVPNVGIQFGRINTTALNSGGNGMQFHNCRIVDSYTLAPYYNFSAESCSHINCTFQNSTASSTAYAAVIDGINHFSITSAFVTQSAPANSAQSFNQNIFLRCEFISGSSTQVSVVWKSGCRQHEFLSCYLAAKAGGFAFTEYCISGTGGVSHSNRYDVHFEGNGVTNIGGYFLLDGTLAAPAFGGFELRAAYIFANEVFKTQGSITSVSIRNLVLDLPGEISSTVSGSFVVFDNPSIWTIDGKVNVISTSYWNLTSSQKVSVNGVPYITVDML